MTVEPEFDYRFAQAEAALMEMAAMHAGELEADDEALESAQFRLRTAYASPHPLGPAAAAQAREALVSGFYLADIDRYIAMREASNDRPPKNPARRWGDHFIAEDYLGAVTR